MATQFPTFVDVEDPKNPPLGTPDADAAYLNSVSNAINVIENALPTKADESSLHAVATSGAYTDLIGQPFIPTAPGDIGAQPAGDYADSASLAPVATSGAYADLTGQPTIPSTPADVGLGNVDNTSDLAKPVSTAQQALHDSLTADYNGQFGYINIRLATLDAITDNGDLMSASLITYDDGDSGVQLGLLTANCTITFATGLGDGKVKMIELVLTQDGIGGHTVTWGSTVRWEGGAPPALSTGANATDRLVFTSYDNGTTWYGDVIGLGYA